MAFNSAIGKQSFTATAGQTLFNFNFKIFNDTDLKVYKTLSGQQPNDETDLLTLNTHYTVSITGDQGGSVTLLSPASINDTIVALRELPLTRDYQYLTNGELRATVLNADQDYQAYLILDNYVRNLDSLKLQNSSSGVSATLPNPASLNFLRWNSEANKLENAQAVVQEIVEYDDDSFRIKEGTKKLAFNVSSISNDTTRIISTPDKNLDLEKIDNINKNVTINLVSDLDYTLTGLQNSFGRIEITDTGTVLTGAKNIITDNLENVFYFVNSTAQTLTVKTSAGSGISVPAGQFKKLRNNTISIVEGEDTDTIREKATTLEAQTGTDDEKYITPLKLREGLNASGTAPVYTSRAWVNFGWNGSSVVINGSGNVASVTRSGVGLYRINFLTAIEDSNYAINSTSNRITDGGYPAVVNELPSSPKTSTYVDISIQGQSSGFGVIDPTSVSISIIR